MHNHQLGAGKSSFLQQFIDNEFVEEYISTFGVDFESRTIIVANKLIKLQIWDVVCIRYIFALSLLSLFHHIKACGGGRLNNLLPSYMSGAQGLVLICDVSDRDTFDRCLDLWMSDIETHCRKDTPVLLVGNKLDKIKLYATGRDFSQDEIYLVNGYFRKYYPKHIVPSCLIEICLKYAEIPKRISTDTQISYEEGKAFADKYGLSYIETSAKTGENVEKAMKMIAYDLLKGYYIGKMPPEIENYDVEETTETTSLLTGSMPKPCCHCVML